MTHEYELIPIGGVKVITEGPTGTGKTYAVGSLVDWADKHKMKVSVLFTETGLETLIGYWTDRSLPIPSCLSWHSAFTRPLGLADIAGMAKKVGQLPYESVVKLTDPNRDKNNAFVPILAALSDFPDDRTRTNLGPVDKWGVDHILVIDGLTELCNSIVKMIVGSRPTMSLPEYGLAQNNLMNLLRLLTQGCTCHFAMMAHVTREKDEITGGVKLMTQAIGSAVSSQIPPLFSDVIYCVREGTSFYWDTARLDVDVKTRNLPIAAKIKPDYAQIMDKWLSRMMGATRTPSTK